MKNAAMTVQRKICVAIAVVLAGSAAVISNRIFKLQAQQQLNCRLIEALKHNDLQSVSIQLNRGANPNAPDETDSGTSFWGRIKTLAQSWLRSKPAPEKPRSALLVALGAWWRPTGGADSPPQNAAIVGLLISHGADVNFRCTDGDTALIEAAISGRPEIVQLLIERGADVKPRDAYGYSALDYVDGRHQHAYIPSIVSQLRRAGARD